MRPKGVPVFVGLMLLLAGRTVPVTVAKVDEGSMLLPKVKGRKKPRTDEFLRVYTGCQRSVREVLVAAHGPLYVHASLRWQVCLYCLFFGARRLLGLRPVLGPQVHGGEPSRGDWLYGARCSRCNLDRRPIPEAYRSHTVATGRQFYISSDRCTHMRLHRTGVRWPRIE